MLNFEDLRIIEEPMRIYKNFPMPVIICNSGLEYLWSNPLAQRDYPSIAGEEGFRGFAQEFETEGLLERLRDQGCCPINDVLPFSGIGGSLLPVLVEGQVAAIVLIIGTHKISPAPPLATKITRRLSASLRACVDGIFATMDTLALKSDMLHTGWVKPSLTHIGVDSYRILRITENISEYVKLQNGVADMRPSALDLSEMLWEMSTVVDQVGRSMEIPVEFAYPQRSCMVSADRAQLEFALFNLVHNSMYFTRPGNIVRVSVAEKCGEILLKVRDHGVGIPKEVLPTVWDPYVTYTHGGRAVGVGLGLPLVRLITLAHNGQCQIRSQLGKGTTVTLRLPAANPAIFLPIARDNNQTQMDNRFSRTYVGLTDATDSPFRE